MSEFHIEEVIVPDTADPAKQVKRYALVDEKHVVWVNGHAFGFLRNMCATDHSSSDCRYLLRETREDALKDSKQWYDWVLEGNHYRMVLLK